MPSLPSVFVATPSMGQVPLQTMISFLDIQEEAIKRGVEIDFGFVSCSLVHHARTLLANVFLDKKKHDLLFWIDSDIKCNEFDFFHVAVMAKKYGCVLGIYPRRSDPPGYFIRMEDDAKPNDDGLVEIEGAGIGFCCVRRDIMQKVADQSPMLTFSHSKEPCRSIFRCDDDGVAARGEDYAFFDDLKKLGIKVYADTQVRPAHIGMKVYECPSVFAK